MENLPLNPFMDCVRILNRFVFLPDFPRPRFLDIVVLLKYVLHN